jgi:hypothetical protein
MIRKKINDNNSVLTSKIAIFTQCQSNFSSFTEVLVVPWLSACMRARAAERSSSERNLASEGVCGRKKQAIRPNTTVMAPWGREGRE